MGQVNTYGNDLFKGAAGYYSKYRPMYPSSLVRYLVKKFDLNGEQTLLDLGCGTGQLTMRFSDWCERIVGADLEPEMLAEAKRLHEEIRMGNIEWFQGDLSSFKEQYDDVFDLVIMSKSFHWMDRPQVLDDLYGRVNQGGGVAVIDDYNPEKQLASWQKKLNEIITHWYGEERRAGNTTYSHPVKSHEEVIRQSPFTLEIYRFPTFEREWTIDSILGNLYSTSYGLRRFLGDHVESFERAVRETLLTIHEDGVFKEEVDLSVKFGMKE